MKQKPKPRIALLREKAGLTQLELSRLVGVTESTIQNWESGRTGTDHIERIIRFCKALNCQVEDLIEYANEPIDGDVGKPTSLNDLHQLLGNQEPVSVNTSDTEVAQQPQAKST
ncbi:transcriptional regulator [Nostoc sp. CENA543]|uniref:helix-turn-helix transcriptional regulator n=1 Tax=Nostoc sp. CENA543 TaxID=1869241 RepID=UPI000CA3E0E3|nr:helix-turn-helix transcriptional regulator [Nostoc sp. CENA543]AUT01106.1 transcriptional regulator [Nostoc sp. CENA543]